MTLVVQAPKQAVREIVDCGWNNNFPAAAPASGAYLAAGFSPDSLQQVKDDVHIDDTTSANRCRGSECSMFLRTHIRVGELSPGRQQRKQNLEIS